MHILFNIMINRFLQRFHSFEYKGNVFFSNWELCPVWHTHLADQTYSKTYSAFSSMAAQFSSGQLHVSELCSSSCKNTLSILSRLFKGFRANSDQEIVVYPSMLPSSDWNSYFQHALNDSYYGGINKFYLAARPGQIFTAIYPEDSLHFIYSNHSFVPLSRTEVPGDTIWPSDTKDPSLQRQYRETAMKDLEIILSLRHSELKKGGVFCLDLLAETESTESPLRIFNEIIEEHVRSGRIETEERKKIVMRNYQRPKDIVEGVLEQYKDRFRLVSLDVVEDEYIAWKEYKENNDLNSLAVNYTRWIKEWTAMSVVIGLSPLKSIDYNARLLGSIYNELEMQLALKPMPIKYRAFNIILQKI